MFVVVTATDDPLCCSPMEYQGCQGGDKELAGGQQLCWSPEEYARQALPRLDKLLNFYTSKRFHDLCLKRFVHSQTKTDSLCRRLAGAAGKPLCRAWRQGQLGPRGTLHHKSSFSQQR